MANLNVVIALVFGVVLLTQYMNSAPGIEDQVALIAGDLQELRRSTAALAAARASPQQSSARSTGGGDAMQSAVSNVSAAVQELSQRVGKEQGSRGPLRRRLHWRWELAQVLEEEGKRHGAEIGVQKGGFSYDMLRLWPNCNRYVLIDVWKHQENYDEGANVADKGHDWLYKKTLERLSPWKEKLVVLRNWSHDASFRVEDGSLDFVYVDARHDFESALEDMRDWWPKLRQGGIFAGHDYTTSRKVPGFALQRDGTRDMRAVVGSVDQFAKEVGRGFYVIPESKPGGKRQPFASWVIRK